MLKPVMILLLCLSSWNLWAHEPLVEEEDDVVLINLNETVIKIPIAKGVSLDDAVESMRLKANSINMKEVGFQALWKELEALGEEDVPRIEIYQFCDAKIAYKMLKHDVNYAAYMPCRIALIEDQKGQGWLVTANLNIFISSAGLPKNLRKIAEQVRDSMEAIIEAGVNGEL